MYNILSIVENKNSGVGYHRQVIPHQYLVKNYPNEFTVHFTQSIDNATNEELGKYQLVQYEKFLTADGDNDKLQERLNNLSISSVCDLDDYWDVPKHFGIHYLHQEKKFKDKIINSIKNADCVSTPCDMLIDEIADINPDQHVEFLANAIDPEMPQWQSHRTESSMCRIGWAGGITHLKDIELLREGIKKIDSDRELRNKYQFVLAGFDMDEKTIYVDKNGKKKEVKIPFDQLTYPKIESIFTNNYRSTLSFPKFTEQLKQYKKCDEVDMFPYRRLWSRSINTYGSLYDDMDVVLVPLENNKFNSLKSNLKIVEAGFKKKPVIVSDVMPYNIDLTHGENSLLIKRNIDWYIYMKKLINSPEMREDLGNALYEKIKHEFHINTATKRRAELYRNLIEKKNK